MTVAVKMVIADAGYSSVQIEGLKASRAIGSSDSRSVMTVEKLDVEPFVENIRIQIRPFAFIFRTNRQVRQRKCLQTALRFHPKFISGFTWTDEVRIGIGLNIFKRQTVKMIAGQGLQPVPKRIERDEQKTLRMTSHDVSLISDKGMI